MSKKAVTYRFDENVLDMVQEIIRVQKEHLKQEFPELKFNVTATDVVSSAIKKEYKFWTGKE